MSGGAMNYLYHYFEDASEMVYDAEISDIIKDLSKLLKSQEWYMSGDASESDYKEDLISFKKKWFNLDRNKRLQIYVDEKLKKLKEDMYGLIGLQC